jgi:hypothetical protein
LKRRNLSFSVFEYLGIGEINEIKETHENVFEVYLKKL